MRTYPVGAIRGTARELSRLFFSEADFQSIKGNEKSRKYAFDKGILWGKIANDDETPDNSPDRLSSKARKGLFRQLKK